MELGLTDTVRVTCFDGVNWTVEEFRTWTGKEDGLSKSGWKTVGHFGRADQACARALDVCVFDRSMDKIVVSSLLRRVAEAKAEILASIQAIDPASFTAAAVKEQTDRADKTLARRKKRDADLALAIATGDKPPARNKKKSVPKWRRGGK